MQKATVAEISAVTGGGRLLAALASAELAAAETSYGPEARVDLDILWIFIGEVRCQTMLAPVILAAVNALSRASRGMHLFSGASHNGKPRSEL